METAVKPILQQLQVLRVKIGRQIFNEKEARGVLTHKLEEYQNCLQVQEKRFDELLTEDLMYWTNYLDSAKNKAKNMKQRLHTLFQRQYLELNDFLEIGRFKP